MPDTIARPDYRSIKDVYDQLKEAGVVTDTLPTWSDKMNQITKTDLFSAGLHDNIIKRASVGVDRLLESTGIPTATESIGAQIGAGLGDQAAGARVGKSLFRSGINLASFAIPGAGWANAARLGIAGLMSGAETYTATGSPAQGVIGAATTAALPAVASVGEGLAAKYGFGKVGQFLGGQVTAAGAIEGEKATESVIRGEVPRNPLSVENLLNLTLGQVPFAALHGINKLTGNVPPTPDTINHAVEAANKVQVQSEAPRTDVAPPDPMVVRETQQRLAQLRGEQVRLDPANVDEANRLLQEEHQTLQQHTPTAGSVFGDSIAPDSPREQVVGKELKSNGKWRAIEVADLPVNPEELRGKVVTYSTAYEPNPTARSDGHTVFGLPDAQWRTVKNPEEWNQRKTVVDPNQPELPPQETPATNVFAHLQDLKKVEIDVDTAQTLADMQKAVVRLQGVQQENGIPPTNDATIRPLVDELTKAGDPTPVQTAVKVEAKKVARQIATAPLTPEEAADISARMGQGGFSVVGEDKLSHKLSELPKGPSRNVMGNIVEEAAYSIMLPQVKTKPKDAQMFMTLVGNLGKVTELTPTEHADISQFIADRDGISVPEAKDEVTNFLAQPHAKEWEQQLEAKVQGMRQGNAEPERIKNSTFTAQEGITNLSDVLNANLPYNKRLQELYDTPEAERLNIGSANNLEKTRRAVLSQWEGSIKGIVSKIPSSERNAFATQWRNLGETLKNDNASLLNWMAVDDLVQKELKQPPQNIVEPNRSPDFVPFVPETSTDIQRVKDIGTTGTDLHKMLEKSQDPVVKAFYEATKPFGDLLARTEVVAGEGKSGASHIWNTGDGTTKIVMSPGTLSASPEVLYRTAAHELTHALTISELDNPTKKLFVDELDQLRRKLIAHLPTAMRGAYNRAISEDWYGKWMRGDTVIDMLFSKGTQEQRQVLYGLMTTKEMVSQGMTRKAMQTFMKGVEATKPFNGFSRFVDTIKRMLGFGIKNTAFEEFLQHTGNLIEHGDYVASFRDFAERYYENQGMNESMVQGNTRRALSVVIGSDSGTTKEDILSQLGQDVSVKSPELNFAKKNLNKVLDKTNPEFVQTEQLMGELGFEPSVAGHDDFVHEALMGREARYHDALDMMSQEAKDYVFAKVKDMQSVLGVLRAATEDYNRGLINIADPKVLSGPVRDAFKAAERIVQVQKVHELGQQLVQESMAMSPDTFAERAANAEPVLADFGNDDPRKPGPLSLFLGQMSRMVRRFPVTAELADRVYELGPNAANMKSNILRVLGVDLRSGTKALSKEGLEASTKAISTPRTLDAVNRWMYWNNEIARQDKTGATMLPTSHPEIDKLLAPLNPTEKQGVIDTVAKQVLSNQTAQGEVLEKMHQVGALMGAHIVMKDGGLKTQESLGLADQMFDAIAADRTNPQLAQQADANLSIVQSKMTPEGFLELLKYTQEEVEKYQGWKKYFDANPAWATAQRLERYLVSFTRGKKKLQLQASSVKEANEIAKGGQHLEVTDQWKGTEDDFPVLGPDAEQWFQRAAELEGNQLRSLVNKGYLDQAGADEFAKMSPVTQQQRETAAGQGGIPKFEPPPRLLSQGAGELPWFWNHVAHADRVSNFWSRKLLRAQASLHLSDPDLASQPELQSMMKQHVENVLLPDPPMVQKISRFTSTWFMGYSFASAMMNGFQTISTAVPEMTSINGGRMLDSYGKWGRALAEVGKESLPNGKWRSDDHKWFAQQMAQAHEWDFSMYSDEAATQEAAATNFKRMMMKQKPQDLGQKLSTAAGVYTNVGMWMFKSVERFNNKVASLMAFDHFMGEGLSREDALTEAKRFNRSVNYGGGRANRPVGAFSGDGDFSRSVAMLATNMQGYNLGVIGQIADYLQRGFFRPTGVTPAEVYGARKAGLQMMATQMVAAGALGLPFVSGVVALLNQFFPGFEVSRHIREWSDDFFKGDQSNGGTLGDIALTGLPSMLGWDMQSRLSIGNVVPGVSEYNGFQPEQLLGPPANLVANFVNGVARVATGDAKGGESFVPPGVRKLFQYVTSGGKLQDYKDRPLFSPTLGETAGIALGFNPKRLSDFNAANKIADQNKTVANRREGQFHQQQAEEVLGGNFGNVRAALSQRAGQDKNYDQREAVRSIAQSAEDLTFPRDLQREGTTRTSADRSRLLSTFNLPSSGVSEVDRLKFRLGVQERLGLRTDPRQELREAQMVDELQRQNPTATRSQLRQQVSGLLRRRPRNDSLLPE